LAILLITLVIGLATIIYQFQSKKEAYKQLEEKNKLITEQSALVRQNKQELEEQALRLKDLNTTKDKLFAIISHDLKSPIGRLEGILQLISDQYIDQSTFNTFAQDLKASTEQVHATLDNLLRWSYSQLNGFELSPKYFYAYYEVDKVAQFLSETAKAKNIKIVNKIPDTAQLYADPESFKLIMRNLISNAIKFSESYTTINLESGIHNGHQIIKVIDQGIGMTDQQQKNLFKMGSESLRGTQGERGLGIGLSLSQEMAEKNHGYIQAESNPAQGSTFSLFLPYDVVN
ncbi:MAG: HAMP domain-containing sensor histidine kinase, partial [Bacteroidota bacterium]